MGAAVLSVNRVIFCFGAFGFMRLTQYFLPVLKENPKEAQIVSHRLMLRAVTSSNPALVFILGCRLV